MLICEPVMNQNLKLAGFLALLMLSLSVSVRAAVVENYPDGSPVYLTQKDITNSSAYKVYQMVDADDDAQIRYLINLAKSSEFRFMRDRRFFTGSDAAFAAHYMLKLHRGKFKTVMDFINKVLAFSTSTGVDHYLVLPDNSLCPIRIVLENELKRLKSLEEKLGGLERISSAAK
jgi:hypothetical protein